MPPFIQRRSLIFLSRYYDMLRATMLKYNFQARIGNMDGIFLAYHNTARIFGFQYLPRSELDERLFGSVELGENAFRLCVALLETIMEQIVNSFPNEVCMKQSR